MSRYDVTHCNGGSEAINKSYSQYSESSFLTHNKYRYFIINTNNIIKANILANTVYSIFDPRYISLRRIIKPLFSFWRVSIDRYISDTAIYNGIKEIADKLSVTPREVFLKRNLSLESLTRPVSTISSILSLNINGVRSKLEELQVFLSIHKPDFICLQETNNHGNEKPLFVNGYTIHEVKASTSSSGLIMGLRKDCGLSLHIIESCDHMILASIRGNYNSTVVVGNVYRSPSSPHKHNCIIGIAKILDKYKNHNCIMVGDWNDTPDKVQRSLRRKGCTIYTNNAPVKEQEFYLA